MRHALVLVFSGSMLLMTACSAGPEDPTLERGPDLAAEMEKFWLQDFTLGNELTRDDRVAMPEGSIGLRPGDTVYYAMYVEEPPAGASVEAVWYDTGGQVIHRETKRIQPEQTYIWFEGPETTEWVTDRDYRVEAHANGQLANRTDFRLEQPETPVAPELEPSTDTTSTVGVDDEAPAANEAGQAQAQP